MLQQTSQWVLQTVVLLGGGAAIVAVVVKWFGDRLATRLEGSWSSQHQQQLEILRDQLSVNRAFVDQSAHTVRAAYLGGQERRAQAAADLWKAFLDAKRQDYMPLEIIDIIPASALDKRRLHDLFQQKTLTQAVKHLASLHDLDTGVEVHRPFLPADAWVLFRTFRAVQARLYTGLIRSYESDTELKTTAALLRMPDGPRQVLEEVLSESELSALDRLAVGHFQWLGETIEGKLLASLVQHLTGEHGARLAFEEASRTLSLIDSADSLRRKVTLTPAV
jgi:hypothetical protein